MPQPVKGRRVYDSPRRREQARATRKAILDAARALFTERGYVATTIDAIAATAIVSPRRSSPLRIETFNARRARGPFDFRRRGGAANPRSAMGARDARGTGSPSPAQDPGRKRTIRSSSEGRRSMKWCVALLRRTRDGHAVGARQGPTLRWAACFATNRVGTTGLPRRPRPRNGRRDRLFHRQPRGLSAAHARSWLEWLPVRGWYADTLERLLLDRPLQTGRRIGHWHAPPSAIQGL